MLKTIPTDLIEFLTTTPLFKNIDAEVLTILAEKFKPVIVSAQEIIIRQGDPGDSLYMLQTGQLEVFLKDHEGEDVIVSSHLPGDNVGEISFLTGANRSASVRTVEPSSLWQLTAHDFEQVANANPVLRSQVEAAIVRRLNRVRLGSALYESRLFEALDGPVLRDLEQALELVTLQAGDRLLSQGDPSDALYLVINGRLRVAALNEDGVETAINELSSGQIVGEMGIFTGQPRNASIYAIRNTLLGRLDAKDFFPLLQKHTEGLSRLFVSRAITKLQNNSSNTERIPKKSGTIAVIPVGPNVPAIEFAEKLTQSLNMYGSVLQISDTVTDQAMGQPGISQAPLASATDVRLSLWFGEQEASHNYLVYVSRQAMIPNDPESAWAERCVQQADHILFVTWADSELQSIAFPQKNTAKYDLALLHPANRQIPVGTQPWLDALRPAWHHHVRWGRDEDVNRIARLLTGRGIGLVLGGGGARGFAHVGVIRALQEANIPIDLVGGTSIGSIVGGLLAIGYDADAILGALVSQMGDRKQVIDFTLPLTSLFTGKKFEQLTRHFFGNIDVVDTWRSYYCVTTDITHAAEVIHRRGPIWKYTRASCSLPIAFPPQVDGSNLLIDGSFMNTYPVNIMHNTPGCGTIIGVNICREMDMSDKNQYDGSLSGWQILNGKLNPFAQPVHAPGVFDTLNRLAELHSAERSQQQYKLTDLYIRPPVYPFNAQDFEQHEKIVDLGYSTAQSLIADWLKSGKGSENVPRT